VALDPHPLVPEDPTFTNPLAAPPALAGPLTIAAAASAAIVLAGLVVAAGSLVVRYRRAKGMERQQLRWLALAATVAAVALVVAVAAAVLGGSVGVVLVAAGASVVVLPLATGAAILRYRLYDLDRIVSRTLAVAAAFQPARRHIQRAVDRQFNRRRHDAARIIEAFGARLRDQVDLDSLTAELLGAVDQIMQPTQALLWLRPQRPSNPMADAGGPRRHR
jgi:hypothetical protein